MLCYVLTQLTFGPHCQAVLGTARELALRVDSGKLPLSLLPTRVALLDPYFSLKLPEINPQSYLPTSVKSTAQQGVDIARFLVARGVALEHLQTSPLAQVYGACALPGLTSLTIPLWLTCS